MKNYFFAIAIFCTTSLFCMQQDNIQDTIDVTYGSPSADIDHLKKWVDYWVNTGQAKRTKCSLLGCKDSPIIWTIPKALPPSLNNIIQKQAATSDAKSVVSSFQQK